MTQVVRHQLIIQGAVQGIGFRPFIYRLASELSLNGWIANFPAGVIIEVEGNREVLETFRQKIHTEKPSLASIHQCEITELDAAGYVSFQIRESSAEGTKQAVILPDIALCAECRDEMNDPKNRRYRYPFINCTNCGPRLTIIESLPYDRRNTSMIHFRMCPECQKEYDDPGDRRFHAQPNACPVCGPHLTLTTNAGKTIAVQDEALRQAAAAIRKGMIVAVKGIGGYHLMVDPFSDTAVEILRERKHREEKPFALLMSSITEAEQYCSVSVAEKKALTAPYAPIVLLKKLNSGSELSSRIAPHNPLLGVMLPYSPIHHLLLQELGRPVIATSGNLSDEPICTDNEDAVQKLGGIADLILMHDRPIIRQADDSVLRIIDGKELVLRRGRGLAPLPVRLSFDTDLSILAVGAHLKNTIAVNAGRNVFISQHIGDLETEQSLTAFRETISDFRHMYDITPDVVVSDKHPEYLSTQFAQQLDLPQRQVQHHSAHIYSCMAENQLTDTVFGVSWDGTGYGDDGTIWGGEFFSYRDLEMKRVGTFRSFLLPGGTAAVKEPRRSALGILFEMSNGDLAAVEQNCSVEQFSQQEVSTLLQMMKKGINSPRTSSAGRIFDAVSSLTGLKHKMRYEGQGAMELEAVIGENVCQENYGFTIRPLDGTAMDVIDWEPMITEIISDMQVHIPKGIISQKFHNTMAEIIVSMAAKNGSASVVLSGGCFQNAYLAERTIERLRLKGFKPYTHQRIPPNDGGISLGQLYGVVLTGRK